MAASLLDRHGEAALDVVSHQLDVLTRAVQMLRDADGIAMLTFWRDIAHAMLSIVARPVGQRSVN